MSVGTDDRIWLSAYAARSCPVKTHNQFDPAAPSMVWQPDESLQELFNGGHGYAAEVLDALTAAAGLGVVDLRPLADRPLAFQQQAAEQAVADGVELILGAAAASPRSAGSGPIRARPVGSDRSIC